MKNELQDFEHFMKRREDASRAFVNGDGEPLGRIVTRTSPATFSGPMGGYEQGAKQVASTHQRGAAQFESGETDFEVLQMAASDRIAYCIGLQRATARLAGKPEATADLDARHRRTLPTIIAGDFNAAPDAASIRSLAGVQSIGGRSIHYHDAWAVAGQGSGHTRTVDNPNALSVSEKIR